MNRRLILLLAPLLVLSAGQKKKGPKPPSVEVLELKARRTPEGTVEIDGRIRNCGEKPLHKLVLKFHILAPGHLVISTQKGAIDEENLDPGEESEFHWQMKDQARSVRIEVAAADAADNPLLVARAGPYPIE